MKPETTAPEDWGYATCKECGREFDLLDGSDSAEWHNGHDCEAT